MSSEGLPMKFCYDFKIGAGYKLGFVTSVSGRGKIAGKSWHSTVKGTVDATTLKWEEFVDGEFAGKFEALVLDGGARIEGTGYVPRAGVAGDANLKFVGIPKGHDGARLLRKGVDWDVKDRDPVADLSPNAGKQSNDHTVETQSAPASAVTASPVRSPARTAAAARVWDIRCVSPSATSSD